MVTLFKKIRPALIGLALGLLPTTVVWAQEPDCIVMSEIANAVIESDISVRLELRDETVVHLRLDRGCPQLAYHQKFTYQATRGRLCIAQDFIIARSGDFCRIEAIELSSADEIDTHEIQPARPEPDQN